MAHRYSRAEFLDRLRMEIERGRPLVMASAGSGIAAKFIEQAGVDIVGVYNTGYFRMQGHGSLAGMLPMADANKMVFELGQKSVLPQIKKVPVIAGVNGVDVLRDMRLMLEDCKRIGFSGVHNFPTVGWFRGEFRQILEETNLGYQLEIDMLNQARQLDLLTIGYAFNEEDTVRLMQNAAPDVYIFHAGITRGGSTGYGKGSSLEDMTARSRYHFELARQIKPDVILLAHGAALENPEDAQHILDHSDCHGVQVGSSIERLAIEMPLKTRAASFKEIRFPRKTEKYESGPR